MKSKFKTIIISIAATTAFWCLAIVGLFWFSSPRQASTDYITQLRRFGFHHVVFEQNREERDATFVVEALQTNSTGSEISRVELLRTNLMPSQTIMLGLRREGKER